MPEFFTFVIKAMLVFFFFWWLGVNFFKHSNEIAEWFEKRKLRKLADKHKGKVVDVRKVYQEQFGFLESPEYVMKRVREIKESLASGNNGSVPVKINALEFIFLVDDLQTDVLKTDKGVYIVSRKNINDLLLEQENDLLHYAKKMREYALKFLPKEGEPLVLEADEVMYWVRNGMLKRPKKGEGNRVFSVSPGLQEVCLDLREDFVDPHYSLEVVSHRDFLMIKNRREEMEKERAHLKAEEVTDTLVEGKLVLFSDDTRRMLIGDEVIVYDGRGTSWKEDLKGNRIGEEKKSKSTSSGSSDSIRASDFVKKETEEIIEESHTDHVELKLPNNPHSKKIEEAAEGKQGKKELPQSLFDTPLVKSDSAIQTTNGNKKEKNKPVENLPEEKPQVKQDVIEPKEIGIEKNYTVKRDHPIIDGFIEALKEETGSVKDHFSKQLSKKKYPFGVYKGDGILYLPVKTLLDVSFDYLSDMGKESFMSEISGPQRKVSDFTIERYLEALQQQGILLFANKLPRSETINFKLDEKIHTVVVVRLSPKFYRQEEMTEIQTIELGYKHRDSQDVVIGHYQAKFKNEEEESKGSRPSTKIEVSLKKPENIQVKKQDTVSEFVKKPESIIQPKQKQKPNTGNESSIQSPVNLTRPPKKEGTPIEVNQEEKQLKQKMKRDSFVKKFCTSKYLFNEDVFDKRGKDCEQFFYTFRINPQDRNEAWLFFDQNSFAELLYTFLEKEKIVYSESNKFLNSFMRDDNKGDLSVRYLYTVPDRTVIKAKLVNVRIPLNILDGLMLDIGYRGGYRDLELKNNLDAAKDINDHVLAEELQHIADEIFNNKFIDCQKDK